MCVCFFVAKLHILFYFHGIGGKKNCVCTTAKHVKVHAHAFSHHLSTILFFAFHMFLFHFSFFSAVNCEASIISSLYSKVETLNTCSHPFDQMPATMTPNYLTARSFVWKLPAHMNTNTEHHVSTAVNCT